MSQTISYREDFYDPSRPRIISTAGLGISLTTTMCCVVMITGTSLILAIVLGLVGITLTCAMMVLTRRSWLKTQARPAAMRQAIAATIGQPLPERLDSQAGKTLIATRYAVGTLTEPGPAKRIVLHARFLAMVEPAQLEKITAAVSRLEGITYTVKTKKNKPGRFVFTPKPPETPVELSEREKIQQRFTHAAREVFGVTAQVAYDWDDTQHGDYLISAEVTGISGLDIALSGKQNQIGRRLASQLPDVSFRFVAYPNEDRFKLFRSRPLPALVMPPATTAAPIVDHRAYRQFEIPLGVGPNETQAVWRPARDAHLLIIGGTGGGKTICEHGVIQLLTQASWRVWLVDGKYIEFLGYKGWRNVEFLAQDVDAQIRLVHLAHETMLERYNLIRDGKIRIEQLDPIALVVDEVTSLLAAVDQRYADTKVKGMKTKPPVMEWLANIGRLGRSAKMHLTFGMQRPDTTIIDGELRDNFGARISLGRLKSAAGSVMMWDNHAIGCQVPPLPGRAVSLIGNEPTMIQATLNANPDPNHDDYNPGIVDAMTPPREVYSRKTILPPTPTNDSDDEEEPKVAWGDILAAKLIDSSGHEVIFDPVASEESRRFRTEPHHQQRGETAALRLQTADSFEEAMALFPEPLVDQRTRSLEYGLSVAVAIARTFRSQAQQKQSGAPEAALSLPVMENIAQEEPHTAFMTTADRLEEGQYATFDQIGEEIMISEIHHEGHSCLVVGYDAEGQEISADVPADADVEARYGNAEELDEAA